MPTDLVFGGALLLSASSLSFWCSCCISLRLCTRSSSTVAICCLALTLAFTIGSYGQLDLARFIPLANVIVLGNWIPLGAAILGGIVAVQAKIPAWRRTATVGMLTGLAWYTVGCDLLASRPQPATPWFQDGVCMQTTVDSCSACCAATILMECGIPASENEMMELCLTRRGGTPELGLYRGLKLKTQKTIWDIQILSCTPEAFLQPDAYPALLLVDVNGPSLGTRSWWRPRRAEHAVIAYGITQSGLIEVGDPSAGRKRWSLEQLRQCWLGDGLRLVRRESGRITNLEVISRPVPHLPASGNQSNIPCGACPLFQQAPLGHGVTVWKCP